MTPTLRLPLVALALIVVLVGVGWWMLRSPVVASVPVHSSHDSTLAASSPEQAAHELDVTAIESAPTRTATTSVARSVSPTVAGTETGFGSIVGSARSVDTISGRVTAGWARVDAAPPNPGSVVDRAEELRLYVASPVVLIDREGHFVFPRLPLGDWIVSIEPEGFARRNTRVTVAQETPATAVEFVTVRAGPTLLEVVLQDPSGAPLFTTPAGRDPDLQSELQPLLVGICPLIGGELQPLPAELPRAQPNVRSTLPGPWLAATLAEPMRGCACVLFANHVLDAVPFVAGQETVVLRVSEDDLRRLRGSLEVLVLEDPRRTPVANALVTFRTGYGRERKVFSDANGLARALNLPVGDVEIAVESEGFARHDMAAQLFSADQNRQETIVLTRAFSMSGTLRFEGKRPPFLSLTAMSVDSGKLTERRSDLFVTDIQDAPFSIDELKAGEYIVGIPSGDEMPDPARVRRAEVPGWAWVDLRRGDVERITLSVTEALLLGSRIQFKGDPNVLQKLLKDRQAPR